MDYIREDNEKLPDEIFSAVERDLRCYPDWIIRIDVVGLGMPSNTPATGKSNPPRGSCVEYENEITDEIKRKVETIERVFDRLRSISKNLIDLRYFQKWTREEVLTRLGISKKAYYRLLNDAIESFARASGYIN